MMIPRSPCGTVGLVLAAGLLSAILQAEPTYYDRHVLFDNSQSEGNYPFSSGAVVAPSTLELSDGRLPVETAHCVSPPNGLRVAWRSAVGGDWSAAIELPQHYARSFVFEGDAVVFWACPDSDITTANAPRVYLRDVTGTGTPSRALVRAGDAAIPAGRWTQVTLPFDSFVNPIYQGTADSTFEARRLLSVSLQQGLDDGAAHVLYLDDVQVVDRAAVAADHTAPAAPTGVAARGFERHVDLTWQTGVGTAPGDVLCYRIYRASDGVNFAPIGLQQENRTRFTDFVGEPGRRASYRVTAVDLAGNESAASAVVTAETRTTDDEGLLNMTQEACFRYYWETAHPVAGLAPEVMPGDPNLLALGGNGFGVMALITAVDRGFVSREAGAARLLQIVRFLARADRFHGVWPHFLDGDTGKAIPLFGKYDDGGDLVETAFMIQGLLAARQYFDRDEAVEREIRTTSTRLWEEVEWDWYRQSSDSEVLYWHWSPNYGFHINHPLIGWNETMIIYLLAIASPTHPVPASLYHTGWAGTSDLAVQYRQGWSRTTQGDHYVNGHTYHGIKLEVGEGSGADLFFTHFSFMGFDPREKRDGYANYFANNRAIGLIQQAYAVENPRGYVGYGADCWGLSAGVNGGGGRAQPRDDNGTINVMASLASMPYTPEASMAALRHFYRDLGAKTWGDYGFHDGFNLTQNWHDEVYMALNQAPIVVMIENWRSGLVWNKFMANPELAPALAAIGFVPDPAPAPEP